MPAQHINDAWSSAEFYANKLLMQYRGVDETQVEWVKGIKVRRRVCDGGSIAESVRRVLSLCHCYAWVCQKKDFLQHCS